MMNAGIGSYAFRYAIAHPSLEPGERMTLPDIMEYCHRNEIGYLQVCDNIPLHQLTDKTLQDSLLLARNCDLKIEIGTTGHSFIHLKRYVDYSRFFGSGILRVVLNAGKSVTIISEVEKELNKLLPLLERHGITLAIENHFDLNPDELRGLIEHISHPLVRICIDPLNSLTLLWGINETFNELKDYIVTAHIKDVKAERDGAGFKIKGCPLGKGIADLEEYIRKLFMANSSCNVFLEQWLDEAETLRSTISLERQWIEQGMKYLKRIISQNT